MKRLIFSVCLVCLVSGISTASEPRWKGLIGILRMHIAELQSSINETKIDLQSVLNSYEESESLREREKQLHDEQVKDLIERIRLSKVSEASLMQSKQSFSDYQEAAEATIRLWRAVAIVAVVVGVGAVITILLLR